MPKASHIGNREAKSMSMTKCGVIRSKMSKWALHTVKAKVKQLSVIAFSFRARRRYEWNIHF